MVLLCLIWALQQIGLRVTASAASPILQICIRSGVSALLLAWVIRRNGEPLSLWRESARAGLLAGFLFGFEFLLIGESVRRTTASHVTVFLYTAPLFAALGLAWFVPSERLSARRWFGMAMAAGGIAIAFLGRREAGEATLAGDALALAAGLAWGATTVVVRTSRLATTPATVTLFYQLVGAFLMPAMVMPWAMPPHFEPTAFVWAHLAFQALVVSFFSYLAWFRLLRIYVAAELGVFSFLTPVFAVVLGWLLVGERPDGAFALGAVAVLAGVALVTHRPAATA